MSVFLFVILMGAHLWTSRDKRLELEDVAQAAILTAIVVWIVRGMLSD